MRRILVFVGLELYALLLAYTRSLGGVRTDEAKYLLNIPYPHPPLVRWILSQTEFLPFQEMFWRIVFATLVVQAVWFLWEYLPYPSHWEGTKGRGSWGRIKEGGYEAGIAWLFSAAVIFQSGSIMMAPLTALEGLILVCVYFWNEREDSRMKNYELWIALFWLLSLFTAYQALLYLPIVVTLFWRMKIPVFQKIVYVFGPLFVLGLYTLTNPFVIVSMGLAGGQNVDLPLRDALEGALMAWIVAGSAIMSVLGTIGIVRGRQWASLASMVLVFLFIVASHRSHYAILFTPLLVGGIFELRSRVWTPFFLAVSVLFVLRSFPLSTRMVIQNLPHEGTLLIEGDFGHEWQYESRIPVRRYRASDSVIRPIPFDEAGDAVSDLRLWVVPE